MEEKETHLTSFRLPLCRLWVALWRVMKFAAIKGQ